MTKIDKVDLKITEILQQDASLTNLAISEQLHVSEATIRRRRTRLEEEGFIRIVCSANPTKLGFKVAVIIGVQAIKSRVLDVEKELRALPEVQFLGLTTGHYDLMLEAWLRSNAELIKFTTSTLGNVEGILRTDIFQFLRLSKYHGWTGGISESGDASDNL